MSPRHRRVRRLPLAGAGGGGGVVLLSSDWSTGTGTADSVLRDDNAALPWDGVYYATNALSVVSASGLGFPSGMDNVLRVTHPAGSSQPYTQVQRWNWAIPAVGDTLYYRWYLRVNIADSEGNLTYSGHHPMQTSQASGNTSSNGEISFKYGSNSDGTFYMALQFQSENYSCGPGIGYKNGTAYLYKFRVYRFELALTRIADGRAACDMRIYDESVSSTVPAFDSSNIYFIDFIGGTEHYGTIAAGYGQDMALPNPGWQNIVTGTNGTSSWGTLLADNYDYWGGFRIRNGGGWIGPYVPGEST